MIQSVVKKSKVGSVSSSLVNLFSFSFVSQSSLVMRGIGSLEEVLFDLGSAIIRFQTITILAHEPTQLALCLCSIVIAPLPFPRVHDPLFH